MNPTPRWMLITITVVVVLLAGLLAWPGVAATLWQILSSDSLAATASYLRGFGIWTPLASLALMVLQSVIAPLPGSLVAAANGVLYGVWWGTLLSWLGGMLGGAASYALGWLLHSSVNRRWPDGAPITLIKQLGARQGFWIVLVARLTPLVSLDAIGYLAGLSRMRFSTYMLANAFGTIPGMLAYTALGNDLARARNSAWQLALIVLALVLLFVVGRRWLRHLLQANF